MLTFFSFILAHFMSFKFAFLTVLTITLLLIPFLYEKIEVKLESELFFAPVYFFFIFLRFLDPSIFDAEKFMDMAFINSILKSQSFPPNDPFLANEKLDCYYYFGHVLGAAIILLSFSPPEIGYNIALAAIAAYTATLIYGIFKEKRMAILAILLTMFSGNAYSFIDFISRPFSIDYLYYWNSTRVIEGTINEFPYFSFIHADLHAHVFAIPMKVLLIALLIEKRALLVITIVLFAIFATNSWDFPFAFILTLIFSLIQRNLSIFAFSILSLIPVAIFYEIMELPKAELLFIAERTDFIQFLSYSATLLALAYAALNKKLLFYSIPISLPFYFLSPILPLMLPIAITAISKERDLGNLLIFLGSLSFMIPDFVAIDSRMNTVFKFYLISWLFLSLGSLLKFKEREISGKIKIFFAILLAMTLVYPAVATPVRYHSASFELDGMRFTKAFGEYEALKWLRDKSGVVIEEGCTHGVLCGYSYGGRVATFTGNPAIIAWTNHEYQWRRKYEIILERVKDVRDFYSSRSCEEMRRIAEKYNVTYVFLGYEERKFFPIDDDIFETCFQKVFEEKSVKVFKVK
ncbi:MAG: DUF2298 domain-containing protein [Archaeoglobaceae archaeon]